MGDPEFRMLLDLWMVSDPWPLSDEQYSLLSSMLDDEARTRDYVSLVDAYHYFEAVAKVGEK